MKAKINKEGVLYVIAENDTESFALNQWDNINRNGCTGNFNKENTFNILQICQVPKITLFRRIKLKIQLFLYR
jgi:hypothetical protein